jgi:hypothetical protein
LGERQLTEELGSTGRTRTYARRLASAFGAAAGFIIIVWLLRGVLGIGFYSQDLFLAALGFIFVAMVLKTKVSRGPVRAVSNFFLNIFGFCLIAIFLIWFLGWIGSLQGGPGLLYPYLPDLVIAAIISVIASYLIREAVPRSGLARTAGRPMLVASGAGTKIGTARITCSSDGIAVPLELEEKPLSYVLFSDVSVAFETPMGKKELLLKSPVAISGIPFRASKASDKTVREITNKSRQELFEIARSALPEASDATRETVDLPFVHISEGSDGELVEVGPIKVRSNHSGEQVKIGPFEFNEMKDARRISEAEWYAFSRNGASVTSHKNRVYAKWNGSSMALREDFMKMKSGSDGFEYDPDEITTTSPLHKLRVTKDNVSLETARFTINVQEGRVVVREQDGKLKSSQSIELARDLKSVLSELAMKQVRDVIAGDPIDLGELLERTEEVLSRYE